MNDGAPLGKNWKLQHKPDTLRSPLCWKIESRSDTPTRRGTQRETKRSQACPMKDTWARTVRKVWKPEVGLNSHGCRTNVAWNPDVRNIDDTSTLRHLVEHHRRSMAMAGARCRAARPPGNVNTTPQLTYFLGAKRVQNNYR